MYIRKNFRIIVSIIISIVILIIMIFFFLSFVSFKEVSISELFRNYFNFRVGLNVLPSLLKGLIVTIEFSFAAEFFGIIIGLMTSLMRIGNFKPTRYLALTYVDVFRGTPLLMQIIIVYYAFPYIGINFNEYVAGIVALSFNSGAYVAEIFRAGIESIEKGQMEAARSLGMSYFTAMRFIILPQAVRRVIPPLTNEFIALIKDSSLLSVIAVSELLRAAREGMTWQANPTPFTLAALLYLLMTLPLTRLVNVLERKLAVK